MANIYTISDLAQEFDLTTRAIRFYEDMGLLEPERSGPGGRNRVYSARDRTRLKLTLRAKRLGLSLTEAKDLIDMYDSPRDTGPQLKKFLVVLAEHRRQLESQLADLEATLDEDPRNWTPPCRPAKPIGIRWCSSTTGLANDHTASAPGPCGLGACGLPARAGSASLAAPMLLFAAKPCGWRGCRCRSPPQSSPLAPRPLAWGAACGHAKATS